MSFSLSHVLRLFDVDGALGCEIAKGRVNLLVHPTQRLLTEDGLKIECKRFAPEGLGFDFLGLP